MITVESAEMQRRLFSQLAGILGDSDCENHNRAWTGVSDEVEEGHFVDVYRDGQKGGPLVARSCVLAASGKVTQPQAHIFDHPCTVGMN